MMENQDNRDYWNQRAKSVQDEDLVTHQDLYQKRLELDLIRPHLNKSQRVLEVGCGNGYVTEFMCAHVAQVDGFDQSEEMIKKASTRLKGRNCNFFVKSLPNPSSDGLQDSYDLIVSVRVLINLSSKEQQAQSIKWIADKLRPGGKFLLLEGTEEGLDALDRLRRASGLKPLARAAYNLNLNRTWLRDFLPQHFKVLSETNIGIYDFLTRFYYPLLVGEQNMKYNTEFHEAAYKAATATAGNPMPELCRLVVLALEKK